MTQDEKKRRSAAAAVQLVKPGSVLGVGSGSTANHFIEALADGRVGIDAAVASSVDTARRLAERGFRVIELAEAGELPLYVDGADEATRRGFLIKGGGGALTREKIVAASSNEFVCVLDDSKLVDRLGRFPLPLEVVPMAREAVRRELIRVGGRPELREGFSTDDGNIILDVAGLDFGDPVGLETQLNQIAGVVTVGLFCRRPADRLLVGCDGEVQTIRP